MRAYFHLPCRQTHGVVVAHANSKLRNIPHFSTINRLNKLEIQFNGWKRCVNYGHRWIVETVFSSIKRTFGEHVTARKYPHVVKEILLKATLYNMFNRMT
jgi:Transposase DDE domain